MFEHLLEAVRAEVSGARALEAVRALSRFHRVQASPGYDQAARWLAERLDAFGLPAEVEAVPGDGRTRCLGQPMPEGWECSRAVATLLEDGRPERLCDYDEHRLSLILRSAPARGRYRIVAVEGGAEGRDYEGIDVTGAVVLTGANVRRAHDLAVVERGAAGLIYDGRRLLHPVRDEMTDPDQLAYTSFWWCGEEPRGWGWVVSPRRGHQTRERLRRGARLEIEVEIESRRFPTDIPLVSTLLPGRGEGEVLILAHLCHPQPSANDNASGVAAALEAARALASLRARGALPDSGCSVRFLWVPELTGTYAWLARDPGRRGRTVAALNLDMVGEDQERCGSTFLLEHPPSFAASFAEELLARIRARAVDWVTSYSGAGHYSMTRMAEVPYSGGSDHAVLVDPAVGVPCPMLIQWPDRYYHSSHDTPDKCDPDSLALAARTAAAYAGFFATAGETERAWLAEAVGRGARRRLLAALDRADPAREVARERVRSEHAVRSLARVGVDAGTRDRLVREVEEFARRETAAADPEPPSAPPLPAAGRRPRRRPDTALGYQWHLLEGFAGLSAEERERWHQLEERVPGMASLFELAWFACDGRRTVEEIVRLAWLETGRWEPDAIGGLFDWTARLGISDWSSPEDEAWSSNARDMASR